VGIGDPVPGGGWRGFGPLLADALGSQVRYQNLSFTGARVSTMRQRQLPMALRREPDAAVIVVGMNDTLRSDFNPIQLREDLDHVVSALVAVGADVVTVRFHDHGRVFRIPGPLRRTLSHRVGQLNEVIDAVVARHGVACVDLDTVAGAYDLSSWAVDRLHPSELGHRMLAREFAAELERAGWLVPEPVSMVCSGGRKITPLHHLAWLVFKGIPWLVRRSRDLVPHALGILLRSLLTGREEAERIAS
jgi:lysophospholipase L1-like esterase